MFTTVKGNKVHHMETSFSTLSSFSLHQTSFKADQPLDVQERVREDICNRHE